MKFGFGVSDPKTIEFLAQHDCDFIDVSSSTLLPFQSEVEFAPVREMLTSSPLPVLSAGGFIPGEIKVTGERVDWPKVQHYFETTLGRAAEIGATIAVWGSGDSRRVPQGFSMERAYEQLERLLHLMADIAERNRITIAIEPINPEETNIIHTVADALALAKKVNRPSVRVLADYYHVERQREPLANLLEAGDWIRHCHTADADRHFPGSGYSDQRPFLETLVKIGYQGGVCIEAWRGDFEREAPVALSYLRHLLREIK